MAHVVNSDRDRGAKGPDEQNGVDIAQPVQWCVAQRGIVQQRAVSL